MAQFLISESFVNRTQGHMIGESEPYEPMHSDNLLKLFHSLQREYGRCMGKVYIDNKANKETHAIGWIFWKRVPYSDTPRETYLQETWVSVHTKPPVKTVKYHYHHLN